MSKRELSNPKTFLGKKRQWMRYLRRALKRAGPADRLHPHVKNAVIELNKLPFVYTFDSNGAYLLPRGVNYAYQVADKQDQIIKELQARKSSRGTIKFRPAFVTLSTDERHEESRKFLLALNDWLRNFPSAKARTNVKTVELSSHSEFEGPIQISKISERMYQTSEFMQGLAKFARQYRLSMRRQKHA